MSDQNQAPSPQDSANLSSTHQASRRQLLLWLGAGSASMLLGCSRGASSQNAANSCIFTPEQTEGPYFVDDKLLRSDIRVDPKDNSVQPGLPLQLTLNVFNAANCKPLAGATVDIWHCNAEGVYSDVKDRSFDTRGRQFLRGYQRSDDSGRVQFTTVYPGWYQGRTVHIHFKIRASDAQGRPRELTSQLYFADALSDQIFALAPYAGRGQRGTRNSNDFIYRDGGKQLTLATTGNSNSGLSGSFDIGLYLD